MSETEKNPDFDMEQAHIWVNVYYYFYLGYHSQAKMVQVNPTFQQQQQIQEHHHYHYYYYYYYYYATSCSSG